MKKCLKMPLVLICLILLSLALMSCSMGVLKTENKNVEKLYAADFFETELQSRGYESVNQFSYNDGEGAIYSDSTEVNVIIELGEGLASSFNQTKYSSMSEYILSSDAIVKKNAMLQKQEQLLNQMSLEDITVTTERQFTLLFNGFSTVIKFGDIEKIEEMDNVKGVHISEMFSIPEVTTTITDELFDTKGLFANSTGYYGEGVLVAVVDTGLDYNHSAFQTEPETMTITLENLAEYMDVLQCNSRDRKYTADDCYINGKVPFAFDYANWDANVMPTANGMATGDYHGTHVAGIVAGNNDVIKGASYDAQLAIMKVFSDATGGAYWDAICAALEDSMVLGVDIANLSLGSPCGMATRYDPSAEFINQCLGLVEDVGLILCCTAGNEHSSFYYTDTYATYNKTSNPDNGAIGYPGSDEASFCIGSIDSDPEMYFTLDDGSKLVFMDSVDGDLFANGFMKLLGEKTEESYGFVYVPDFGKQEGYQGLDVTGKIVLVSRGEISFAEKLTFAAANGAAACIIANNETGSIHDIRAQVINPEIPLCTITMADGATMSSYEGNLTLNVNNIKYAVSNFSARGVLRDLTLGVDIMGVGGSVYSAMPSAFGSEYAFLSGTSMAAPNVSAVSGVLLGILRQEYPEKTRIELRTMIYQILQSTAFLATELDGRPVSPRLQGAGIASLENAVATDAYLTVTGSDRVTLSLGSDLNKEGIYTLYFNLVNISDNAITYNVDNLTFTETTADGSAVNKNFRVITEEAYMFAPEMTVNATNASVNGNYVTVEGRQTAKLKVVLTLSEQEKAYMDANFENGIYVEGFITLTPSQGPQLSIPWIAFYGDWEALPVFEVSVFDEEEATFQYYFGLKSAIYTDSGTGAYTGLSYNAGTYSNFSLPMGWEAPKASADNISYNIGREIINGTTVYVGVQVDGMNLISLRDMEELHIVMMDVSTDEEIFHDVFHNIGKYNHRNIVNLTFTGLFPVDNFWANNQTFAIEVYTLNNGKEMDRRSVEFTYDFEVPTLTDAVWRTQDGKTYLDLSVYDNHVAQAVGLLTEGDAQNYSNLWNYAVPIYSFRKNATNTITIDMTDHMANIINNVFAVELFDYAMNSMKYEITLPEELKTNNSDAQANAGYDINDLLIDYVTIKDGVKMVNGVVVGKYEEPLDSTQNNIVANDDTEEPEFVIENGVLKKYNGEGGDVVVPDGVVETASRVFANRHDITSITFPEGFKELAYATIQRMLSLEKVVLPSTFEVINAQNFFACPKLSSINMEDTNVNLVGYMSFAGLTSLKSITFPKASEPLTFYNAFIGIIGLESIIVENDVDSLGDTFTYMDGLIKVEFKGTVNNVNGSFFVCKDLKEVIFHEDIQTLGNDYGLTFLSLDSFEKVEFFGNVDSISGFIFNSLPKLSQVIFHKGINSIGSEAFYGCDMLTSFSISEDNEYLIKDEYGVLYNKDVTSMFFPHSWDYEGAFVIPSTVTLKPYQFAAPTMVFLGVDAVLSFDEFYAPSASAMYKYDQAPLCKRTKLTELVLADTVTALPEYFLFKATSIKKINLDNITVFGTYSLSASGIESLTIKDNDVVGSNTWRNCASLTQLNLSPNATYSSYTYFYAGLASMKEIIVPEFVNPSAARLFENCTSLERVEFLKKGIETTGIYLFNNCYSLTEVIGLEDLKTVANYTFYNCTSIKSLSFPKATMFGYFAFYNCTSLEDCYWTDELTTFRVHSNGNYNTFYNCSSLKSIYITEKMTEFPFDRVFVNCGGLESITVNPNNAYYKEIDGALYNHDYTALIKYPAHNDAEVYIVPETVTAINNSVFANTVHLKEISILGVTTIGNSAFENSSIEKVNTDSSLASIGNYAFRNSEVNEIDISYISYLGEQAFRGTKLKEVVINSVITVWDFTFADIEQLEKVTIENGNYFYYALTFYNSPNIKEIILDENNVHFVLSNSILYNATQTIVLDYIGDQENVTVQEGVTRIEMQAFRNSSVKSVSLPSTLVAIGDRAFYGCNELTSIEFKGAKAPKLEGLYVRGMRYLYANFVTELENVQDGLNITIVCNGDASYSEFIWNKYFITID